MTWLRALVFVPLMAGCVAMPEPDVSAMARPSAGLEPEKLWMTSQGFRVRLSDGTTCIGQRPAETALVADDRPGWSGKLTGCAYSFDYHIVRRDLFGMDAMDQVLSTRNKLFGTFQNGPNWQLCLLDVPGAGPPAHKCASQAIKSP